MKNLSPEHVASVVPMEQEPNPLDFPYELQLQSPLLEKYRPTFIGSGGNSIVYTIEGHPDIVAKLNFNELLADHEKAHIESHQPASDTLDTTIINELQKSFASEQQRNAALKKYFGKEHMVPARSYIVKLPISARILQQLYYNDMEASALDDVSEVWTVVNIQKKVAAIAEGSHLSMESGYAELNDENELLAHVDTTLYKTVTQNMLHPNTQPVIDVDVVKQFLKTQHPTITRLLEESEHDKHIQDICREIVRKAITYTKETGEILDLFGPDNLVISNNQNIIEYVLPDVVFFTDNMVAETQSSIRTLIEKGEISFEDTLNILNGVNYVRFINSLSHILGLHNYIELLPQDIDDTDIDYLELFRKNLP